jgi:uncharacterized RDD family membrane protein YckC
VAEAPPPIPRRPAGFGWRTLAFVLDLIPLALLGAFLAERLADEPAQAGRRALDDWMTQLLAAYGEVFRGQPPERLMAVAEALPPASAQWIVHAGLTFTLTFAVALGLQELLLGGRTVGKSVVNLRVIDVRTGEAPGLAGCFLRGAWKGIFCCFPNPLVSLVGLVGFHLPLFRKDGRSLHDLATFTQVVDGQDER